MTDNAGKDKGNPSDARAQRLKSALRDNLKRRKAQARGRAGMAIVTPEDDARAGETAPEFVTALRDRNG